MSSPQETVKGITSESWTVGTKGGIVIGLLKLIEIEPVIEDNLCTGGWFIFERVIENKE